jgi:branched-chain amino acid transport system ATP-binding protein
MTAKTTPTAPLLEIVGLNKNFGGLRAVKDLDLTIKKGELAGLIGPNGAGKTTAFNLITGIYVATSGSINFDSNDLVGSRPESSRSLSWPRRCSPGPKTKRKTQPC